MEIVNFGKAIRTRGREISLKYPKENFILLSREERELSAAGGNNVS
jgi:hypothetical protein